MNKVVFIAPDNVMINISRFKKSNVGGKVGIVIYTGDQTNTTVTYKNEALRDEMFDKLIRFITIPSIKRTLKLY